MMTQKQMQQAINPPIPDMMAVITVVKFSRGRLDSPSTDSEVSVWKKGRMRNK